MDKPHFQLCNLKSKFPKNVKIKYYRLNAKEGLSIDTVPDRRSRVLEVVIVRRLSN
jgi:hypothetical protein